MPAAYQPRLRPVALTGQVVRLQPDDELRRVQNVEPVGEIGPLDFGSASSGSTATDSDGNEQIEITELEMSQNQFGQFRIEPISDVEVELHQDGRQEQRMTITNSISQWTPRTPAQLREFFVLTTGVPYLIVNNPTQRTLDRTLVKFHGFKYNLDQDALPEGEVSGQPVSIPVDKLERTTQQQSATTRQASATQRAATRRGR